MKKWLTKNTYSVCRILAGRSNVFLVTKDGKNILVDTSPAYRWNSLRRRLGRLKISRLDYLVLTHTHFDHAANANKVGQTYGAKVLVNERESGFLEAGDNVLIKGTNPLTAMLVNLFAKRLLSRKRYEPCKADIKIDLTYSFNNEGLNIYLVHSPGHTIGSMSLIVDDEIAIVGDAMFGVFPWSVMPPFAENAPLMLKSWDILLATKCKLFLPSHGNAKTKQQLEQRK
jgi:hydroxyacylglutathione hydrolase